MFSRDESWGGKGSKNGTEDRPEGESRDRDDPYEGPAGMDPDGVIESNWDKVILCSKFLCPDLYMIQRNFISSFDSVPCNLGIVHG